MLRRFDRRKKKDIEKAKEFARIHVANLHPNCELGKDELKN